MSTSESTSGKELVVRKAAGALEVARTQGKRKKLPKKALDEDEFTDALSHIIQRDFFPDIPKLQAQMEFIEATETNDFDRLRQISERFSTSTRTPMAGTPAAATPSGFETPSVQGGVRQAPSGGPKGTSEGGEGGPPDAKRRKKPEERRLDAFLARYESEDDASFGELMDKAHEQHLQKHAWLFEKVDEANLALEAPDRGQTLAITDGGEEAELGGGGEGGGGGGREGGGRGVLKTWRYTPKNTLMYIPDGVEESAKERVEREKDARKVVHGNTRLSSTFLRKTQAAVAQMEGQDKVVAAKEKIGVDGRPLADETESPQVNGYGFEATPQIHPGVDASPLMTWGTIDSTPFRLDGGDITPAVGAGPTFKIPPVPRREQVAFKLVDDANKANRERKKIASSFLATSPALRQKRTPSAQERLEMLSPAARKLVSRTSTPGSLRGTGRPVGGGVVGGGPGGSTDKALRASYTPKHSTHSTPGHHRGPGGTPGASGGGGDGGRASTPSLTDNLLNLGTTR